MSFPARPQRTQDRLVSRYQNGDVVQSRRVSDVVLSGLLEVPAPPARLVADWERETASRLALEPGDVEALPLARARARWPDYGRCVEAVAQWTRALGLPDLLPDSDVALMACRGARYHHDGAHYGAAAFCNLFLGEDKGLEVHFPAIGRRIPLVRGTVLLFDTGQPHAVILRDGVGFDAADFGPHRDCTQVFLTWELPIDDAGVARALGIAFEPGSASPAAMAEGQLWLNGDRVEVCPRTGAWRPAGYSADTST